MAGHGIERCPGWGDAPEGWLDECRDCQHLRELAQQQGAPA